MLGEGLPGSSEVKKPPANTLVWSLGQKDPLEEKMATHSSILTWKIPQTEKPGGLQSTESQRVQHDLATQHSAACEQGKEGRGEQALFLK